MPTLSPGREHDLKMLEQKFRSAKTAHERNKWANKIRIIKAEGKRDEVRHLRGRLIDAYRNGDQEKAEKIADELYKRTR